MVDDLIYGKLLDSLYPKSFLMTDEDGLQHEVIHYGDVKNAIEDLRIELKQKVGISKMENGDTISRQDAIDALDCISGVEEVLRSLPPVQPMLSESDRTICKMYLNDRDRFKTCNEYKMLMRLIDNSAQPKQGEWEYHSNPTIGINPEDAYCSCCGFHVDTTDDIDFDEYNFCPRCGAKMER